MYSILCKSMHKLIVNMYSILCKSMHKLVWVWNLHGLLAWASCAEVSVIVIPVQQKQISGKQTIKSKVTVISWSHAKDLVSADNILAKFVAEPWSNSYPVTRVCNQLQCILSEQCSCGTNLDMTSSNQHLGNSSYHSYHKQKQLTMASHSRSLWVESCIQRCHVYQWDLELVLQVIPFAKCVACETNLEHQAGHHYCHTWRRKLPQLPVWKGLRVFINSQARCGHWWTVGWCCVAAKQC